MVTVSVDESMNLEKVAFAEQGTGGSASRPYQRHGTTG
jgi:hypothetical protein